MPRLPAHEKDSRYLTLRVSIDDKPERIDVVIAFLLKFWDDVLVAHEIGQKTERPHIHCLVFHKGSPKVTFSNLFKMHVSRQLQLQSSEWSVTNIEPTAASERSAFCYHCKGEKSGKFPDIRHFGQTSRERVQEGHNEYWAKKLHTYFIVEAPDTPQTHQQILKTVKTKSKTWTEKVCDFLDEHYTDMDWDYTNDKHIQLMADIVLEKLGDRGKAFDGSRLKQHVLGFLNYVNAKGLRNEFSARTVLSIRSW